MSSATVLLLVLLWPLLLAVAVASPRTRLLGKRLAPWAALPALFIALGLNDSTVNLQETMLGGVLRLDSTGRAFLLLAAAFSLAAGLLARERIGDSAGGNRFALCLLLATAGLLGLALAGDALLYFTAATLFGYSLYGMLAPGSASAVDAARVFVVLLVTGDLVVFELLLVLAHDAGGTAFVAFHHALLLTEFPVATFVLLLIGFGIKLGLIGFHLWLAPVFVSAAAPVRPMVVGFVVCAGMLGWLRLLPLGEVYWPGAGVALQWLAQASLVYAVVVGMLQAHFRSVLGYGVMAFGALFLWLLGAVLAEPTLWPALFTPLHGAIMQAGFALAMLFLLPGRIEGSAAQWLRRGFTVAGWLAALMLVAAPLGLTATLAPLDPTAAITLSWLGVAFALLAARSLRLQSTAPITPGRGLAVAGLSLATLLAAASYFFALTVGGLWQPALFLLFAAVVGWFGGDVLARRLPAIPPGEFLDSLERGIRAIIATLNRLADRQLPLRLKAAVSRLHRLRATIERRELAERLEKALGRWTVAMMLLLVLGLTVACWSVCT